MSEYIESKLNLRKIWKKWKNRERGQYMSEYIESKAKSKINMKKMKKGRGVKLCRNILKLNKI